MIHAQLWCTTSHLTSVPTLLSFQNSENNRGFAIRERRAKVGEVVQKFCANKSRKRRGQCRRGRGPAVAESAFNRELLFKARHGLRQRKRKKKLRLKWISCFLSDYYHPSLPLQRPPIILLTVSQLCRLTETSAAKCLFHSNFTCFCLWTVNT